MPVSGNKNMQYANAFGDVCMLLCPLVYFDDIVKLKSFDDDFLSRMELAFMTRMEIPRNLDEAQRLYDLVLSLPDEYVLHTIHGREVVAQPFMA